MLLYHAYLDAYLGCLEFWCASMDRFHPAYGGWARVIRHQRTGTWS